MNKFYLKSFIKLFILISIINLIRTENEEERLIKEELVKYFQATDSDEDHQLTVDELARWIRKIHNIVLDENVDSQWENLEKEIIEENTWQDYEVSRRETINWDSYKKKIYEDHLEEHKRSGDQRSKEEIENEFNQIVSRFENRFKLADEDGTGYLLKDEFKYYLHPEESKNETVLNAAVEDLKKDLDRNGDQMVSFDEYLEHIKSISSEEEKNEPEFDEINKENFEIHLDKNKNGFLDLDELKNWLIPDFEKYRMEAAHLMEMTDLNKDNELQLEELITEFDKFTSLLPPKFYATLGNRSTEDASSKPKHDEF